ncbi:radical SAM protein [Leptospira yasudae]|uniref:Radical SAM protein n=1 Tax=Leptospira yasudae TaxID=2202201 RepID=A0ABX9M3H0_9LEPT|nr:radical SAM protein [Leptospira yasudae]RHX79982.1 radical SAM protein [Leptospira yasudae]RHX94068.1 radical SAM protein [Leptospira yasudae]TGK25886.1 radical SAM protein [Leptospira yasudae]TGM02985.1 radical SAM protein [Leptospira yasudae]TGM99111.1 radical SAM protein [Leptospira yasudae]
MEATDSIRQSSTIPLLEEMERKYKSIPMEAIVKQDILRQGIHFLKEAFEVSGQYKTKDYFIFSFDHIPLSELGEGADVKAPEEIKVSGGHFNLLPTVISTRNNPNSPYKVKKSPDGKPSLYLGETFLGNVEFPPLPAWYRHKTKNGKIPGEIAPVIEWGYLIYLTVFRNCQYFGKEEECAYCDINHNYRQQKNAGRPYTGVKDIEDILEVLSWIDAEDPVAKVYTITGGSVITSLKKKNEIDFYLEYAQAIESKFPGRWMGKIVSQAWEIEDCQKFKDAGIQVYHPNYEVWDKNLFQKICPGKEAYIGRDNWIRRVVDSAEVFGPSYVIPNFVGGVELSKPYGFATVAEAIASTGEGLDFFMSKGIMPRFTAWCPEPYTTLGTQAGPPLEYFCELLTVWKATFEKYNLPVPPGYGEPGPGKAVFSVSAFMDVIGYQGRN